MTWMLDKAFLERLDLSAYDAQRIATRVGVSIDEAKKFVDPNRQYRVQSNLDYGWVAGKNGAGQPTLVFIGRPPSPAEIEYPLNAISFDLNTKQVSTTTVKLDDERYLDDSEYVLGMLEDEIGFDHTGSANVLAFKYPNIWSYAVVPFAFHHRIPGTGADEEDDDDIDLTRKWICSGNYVLHCGNAYFMNFDGEVESS